jgi:hypothetical protein
MINAATAWKRLRFRSWESNRSRDPQFGSYQGFPAATPELANRQAANLRMHRYLFVL